MKSLFKYLMFFVFATILKQSSMAFVCQRTVTEYLIPKAEQTHEILLLKGKNMLLITQYSNSKLVKAIISPKTGHINNAIAYQIDKPESALHGLTASIFYPEKVWVSLEKANKLLLLDPVGTNVKAPPQIERTIDIPKGGDGPHHIAEYDTNIWATLKTSLHILRINHQNTKDYKLYKAKPIPVFLARHPISGEIYASEYKSNSILRINPKTNKKSRIMVPADVGESPVGIVANDKFVWVALLSIESHGTGSFGKIFSNGTVQWFQLKRRLGQKAALLHIAFDVNKTKDPGVWFLGSSLEDPLAYDMIIRTHFDKNFENFEGEEIICLPSQEIKAHRMVTSELGLYVTELTASRVAFYKQKTDASCDFGFIVKEVNKEEAM